MIETFILQVMKQRSICLSCEIAGAHNNEIIGTTDTLTWRINWGQSSLAAIRWKPKIQSDTASLTVWLESLRYNERQSSCLRQQHAPRGASENDWPTQISSQDSTCLLRHQYCSWAYFLCSDGNFKKLLQGHLLTTVAQCATVQSWLLTSISKYWVSTTDILKKYLKYSPPNMGHPCFPIRPHVKRVSTFKLISLFIWIG